MQDARKCPRMDEDPGGPRHVVAGGPVGYKHGMRGEVWGPGHWRNVAKGKGTARRCKRSGTGETGQKARSNRPVRLGNQSPWSGEPWANHGEPGHGKSGKCREPRDSREMSARVIADPEARGSRARVRVQSLVRGTWGNVETVAPWPPAADGRQPSTSVSRVGTPACE